MIFEIILWIIIGSVAGLLVSLVSRGSGRVSLGVVAAGIIGSVIGGVLYSSFSIGSLTANIGLDSLVILLLGLVFFSIVIYALSRSPEKGQGS